MKTKEISPKLIEQYYSLVAEYITSYAKNQYIFDSSGHCYGMCNSPQDLMHYVQQGMYECYVQNTLPIDRIFFVLSGPHTSNLMSVARSVKTSLDKRGMYSYYIIAGQQINIIAYCKEPCFYPLGSAKEIALFVVARMHKKATMEEYSSKNKVYIDTSYNNPHSIVCLPYSLVKGKQTTVACPYSWDVAINTKKLPVITPQIIIDNPEIIKYII